MFVVFVLSVVVSTLFIFKGFENTAAASKTQPPAERKKLHEYT